jgi:hypothetical protein
MSLPGIEMKTALLVLLLFATQCLDPLATMIASAEDKIGSGIYVTIPGTGEQQVWRFDTTATKGTKLGTYPISASYPSSKQPTIKVSPNGKWLASGWLDAEPLKLELGRVGETPTPMNKPGEPLDAILDFGFSPDSRYFTYTFYTEVWRFGVIDLQSGKRAEITDRAVTIPPDIDVTASFGKMIPTVTAWSRDSQTVYFETFLMLGCRGPHAVYSAKLTDLQENRGALPSTTLVSPQGADVFSYAFSPDRALLAFAYGDDDCGAPKKLGVVTLLTNQSREVIKASPDRAILVLGWADNGKTIIFTSDPAPEGDSGPVFPLTQPRLLRISYASGGPDKLPDLTTNPNDLVENLAVVANNLFYTITTDAESDAGVRTLYSRPLSGSAANALALIQSKHEISLWPCGDTLYFATAEGNLTTLYRVLPDQKAAQKLHEAAHIAFAGCAS